MSGNTDPRQKVITKKYKFIDFLGVMRHEAVCLLA